MSPARTAEGFAAVLELFAAWLDRGLRADELALLAALPGLANTLGDAPLVQAQQALQRLLQLEVQPLASVFLHPAGRDEDVSARGAGLCSELAGRYQQLGVPRSSAQRPDHIASLLAALAHGCAAHARWLREGDAQRTARLLDPLRELCDRYLLSWLPALNCALQREAGEGAAWLQALVGTALDTVCAWRAPGGRLVPTTTAESLTDLVARPETGLREIAGALCAPASCGMFLSRSRLQALGRGHQLPAGFGPRARLLHNLLQAACDYERLPALLTGLAAEAEAWDALLEARGLASPLLAACLDVWRQRLHDTLRMLRLLREAAPLS